MSTPSISGGTRGTGWPASGRVRVRTPATPRRAREASRFNDRSLSGNAVRRRVMKGHLCRILGVAAVWLAAALPARALTLRCPPDAVKVGDACIDRYEASIWQIPPDNTALVRAVQLGRATVAQLTNGGATQVSPAFTCTPAFPK